jgi:hypothetical protein
MSISKIKLGLPLFHCLHGLRKYAPALPLNPPENKSPRLNLTVPKQEFANWVQYWQHHLHLAKFLLNFKMKENGY